MPKATLLISILLVLAVLIGALVYIARFPEIAPVGRPDPASFDPTAVTRGAALARIGGCADCHTREGGQPFAGGLALPTPFGTIHTTNITPDMNTGIGAWSESAFLRAMKKGIGRRGNHLYPAFPYDHFTRVKDEDVRAIYAYLMAELPPVSYTAPTNEMAFPFNLRLLLAGWNLLFLDGGELRTDPTMDAEWNRGAYLVEGLGHCGACHTPRNALGAEKRGADAFGGGFAEGWYAPALNRNARPPVPWTRTALVNYLVDGWDEHHGIAAGPMIPVVNNLAEQTEDDAFAIAAYIAWLMGLDGTEPAQQVEEARSAASRLEWGAPAGPALPDDAQLQHGANVFERHCASCHKAGGLPVPLALTASVRSPDPYNAIAIAIHGIKPPRGALRRSMPGRGLEMSDMDVVALMSFVRDRFSDQPPWPNLERRVIEVRQVGEAASRSRGLH